MPALYVYTYLLPGRKLPRGYAEPPHLRDVEMGEESTQCWSLLDGGHLATYAAQRAPSSSAANGLVYYVPGAVVWKGRRIAATDLLLSTYGVVAGRRLVGDAELNPPSKPEYILLDKYIYNKEATRVEI
jgi:hypothetical protein